MGALASGFSGPRHRLLFRPSRGAADLTRPVGNGRLHRLWLAGTPTRRAFGGGFGRGRPRPWLRRRPMADGCRPDPGARPSPGPDECRRPGGWCRSSTRSQSRYPGTITHRAAFPGPHAGTVARAARRKTAAHHPRRLDPGARHPFAAAAARRARCIRLPTSVLFSPTRCRRILPRLRHR